MALHMLREAQSPAGSTKQLSSFLFAVERLLEVERDLSDGNLSLDAGKSIDTKV
jgi:hypothetical protein